MCVLLVIEDDLYRTMKKKPSAWLLLHHVSIKTTSSLTEVDPCKCNVFFLRCVFFQLVFSNRRHSSLSTEKAHDSIASSMHLLRECESILIIFYTSIYTQITQRRIWIWWTFIVLKEKSSSVQFLMQKSLKIKKGRFTIGVYLKVKKLDGALWLKFNTKL